MFLTSKLCEWFCPSSKTVQEGNVLFDDAHSTHFNYSYMASDSEKGNLLPPHRLLFPINSKGSFYMHHPTDRMAHTTAFVTPVVEHWLEREIAQLKLYKSCSV